MRLTWRGLFVIAALILFVIGALVALATISGPAPLALIGFGLAALAASMLPVP